MNIEILTKNIYNPGGLNVLLVGEGKNIECILSSKFLRKLYTTSEINYDGVLNIRFNTFKELAKKCKALQIDLVIVEESKWINQGITDVLRINHINCFAPSAKWADFGIDNVYAREMLEKYNINVPEKTLLPVNFPLILRGKGILKRVNSISEVIKTKEFIFQKSPEIARSLYLEKYLDGEKYYLTSIFDGMHLLTFPQKEIEKDIIKDYSNKIELMLKTEKADFVGFINSEVVLSNNKLYNISFSFEFNKPDVNIDILYILWLSIFQKANEISFS